MYKSEVIQNGSTNDSISVNLIIYNNSEKLTNHFTGLQFGPLTTSVCITAYRTQSRQDSIIADAKFPKYMGQKKLTNRSITGLDKGRLVLMKFLRY